MNLKKILSLLMAALALALSASGCAEKASGPVFSQAAQPMESSTGEEEIVGEDPAVFLDMSSFQAETLEGGSFSPEDFSGKDLTIINCWGLFCSPCVAEMPDLAKFANALPDNVQFIMICVDGAGAPEDAKKLLEDAGFSHPVTLVSGDESFTNICNTIQYLPLTFFVGPDGRSVGSALGGGGRENLSADFTAMANRALKALGKDAISLEG